MSGGGNIRIAPGVGLSGRWDGQERTLTGKGWVKAGPELVHIECSYGTARLTWQRENQDDVVLDVDMPVNSTINASFALLEGAAMDLVNPI